jgi:hypothetical protein
MTTNPYESEAREVKARKLADALDLIGKTAADARTIAADPEARSNAVALAKVKPASDETWERVFATMESRERMRSDLADSDPFDGFPAA